MSAIPLHSRNFMSLHDNRTHDFHVLSSDNLEFYEEKCKGSQARSKYCGSFSYFIFTFSSVLDCLETAASHMFILSHIGVDVDPFSPRFESAYTEISQRGPTMSYYFETVNLHDDMYEYSYRVDGFTNIQIESWIKSLYQTYLDLLDTLNLLEKIFKDPSIVPVRPVFTCKVDDVMFCDKLKVATILSGVYLAKTVQIKVQLRLDMQIEISAVLALKVVSSENLAQDNETHEISSYPAGMLKQRGFSCLFEQDDIHAILNIPNTSIFHFPDIDDGISDNQYDAKWFMLYVNVKGLGLDYSYTSVLSENAIFPRLLRNEFVPLSIFGKHIYCESKKLPVVNSLYADLIESFTGRRVSLDRLVQSPQTLELGKLWHAIRYKSISYFKTMDGMFIPIIENSITPTEINDFELIYPVKGVLLEELITDYKDGREILGNATISMLRTIGWSMVFEPNKRRLSLANLADAVSTVNI